jgi:hypothetical protein
MAQLLNKVADLLSIVHIYKSPVSSLHNMIVVRCAHAVLPIISISVSQLIKLARRLIRYVKHRVIVSYHLILHKFNAYQL